MILNTDIDQLDALADFSWDIQSHLEHASYPMWESKEKLREIMIAFFEHPNDRVLACYKDGELLGVINLFVSISDKHLETSGVYASDDIFFVYQELMAYLAAHYPGYELIVGLPAENNAWKRVLCDAGASLLEASTAIQMKQAMFKPDATKVKATLLDIKDFDSFAAFHDVYANELEMAWTSETIKDNFNIWRVFIVRNEDTIVGSSICNISEPDNAVIYAMFIEKEYATSDTYKALFTATAADAFAMGKRCVLCFTDEGGEMELEAAMHVGFSIKGTYRGYKLMV